MVVDVHSLTIEEILKREPLLRELHQRASKVEPQEGFCANTTWYERFKPLLVRLVGSEAKRPELQSEEAYDTAYTAIYDLLPDCQHEPNVFCL